MILEIIVIVCVIIAIVCTLVNIQNAQHVRNICNNTAARRVLYEKPKDGLVSTADPKIETVKLDGTKKYTLCDEEKCSGGIDFDVLIDIINKRETDIDIHKTKLDKIYNAHRDYISLERMCLRTKFTVQDLWYLYAQVEPVELDTEPYERVYVSDMDREDD